MGMMMLYPTFYAETCKPEDQLMAMKSIDSHYYFSDVQVRGRYSPKAIRYLASKGITLQTDPADDATLKEGVVDYIGFSYYNSNVATTRPDAAFTGGTGCAVKNPYLAGIRDGLSTPSDV